jgi:hypothetical protein
MGFKIKGGRSVVHTKWVLESDGITLTAVASDCNDGSIFQTVTPMADGKAVARVRHIGRLKFSNELVGLTQSQKVCRNTESAKGWCRKTANGLAFKHDLLIEMQPEDFRKLSLETASGPLSPGSEVDFGASQRPIEKFRSKRRRK